METRVVWRHIEWGMSPCDGVGDCEAPTPPPVADLCSANHSTWRHASCFSNFPLLFLCSRGPETRQACFGEWLSCICRCSRNWLAHSSARTGAQQWRAANALPKPPQWLFDVYRRPLTRLELRTAYRRACVWISDVVKVDEEPLTTSPTAASRRPPRLHPTNQSVDRQH